MALLENNDAFQDRGLIKITDGTRTAEINDLNEVLVTQGSLTGSIDGLNASLEDASFLVGDSPATLNFFAAEGRNAIDGWVICDGAGDMSVQFSRDGVTFGDAWTMKEGEVVSLRSYDIHSIRVTYIADSAYRVNLI
jgi:hypothetical protein